MIYRNYIPENQFVTVIEGDLVRAQRFTGSGVHLVTGRVVYVNNGSSNVEDNSIARYFDVELLGSSDEPGEDMDFIRLICYLMPSNRRRGQRIEFQPSLH